MVTVMNHQYGALSFKCSASGRPLESQRGNGSGINSIGGGNADKPSSYNYEKDDGSVDRYILHGFLKHIWQKEDIRKTP